MASEYGSQALVRKDQLVEGRTASRMFKGELRDVVDDSLDDDPQTILQGSVFLDFVPGVGGVHG